ncbi:MFS transporter [Aquisalimonas sp.]|uniref:MFS transporter n=1 Tax=Aquisalimonas sp. TaxID=1872621 RepID=UPI0025C29AF8|nr:MFS transporter [Aquisalimonas sp.]
MNSVKQPKSLLRHGPALVLVCAAGIVALSLGMRQSFGIFMPHVSELLGGSREVFSLAIALQNLIWGLAQPGVGMVADRYGARIVAGAGGMLYGLGLAATALVSTALALNINFGLLIGLGLSATSFVVVLGAVARVVPQERRGLAFGVVTAVGSFGMFAVVPLGQGLVAGLGWQGAFLALSGFAVLMVLMAMGFPGAPTQASASGGLTLGQALRQAAGHRGYWLLNAGFFVCGFHVMFIATHLPSYLVDAGLPAAVGAMCLALIGLFNIIGSFTFGMLGDRLRKPLLLSGLYSGRVAVITVFMLLPLTAPVALIFSAVMGFLWLGTVPLTSGLVAQIFGARYMGSLFGIVFLSHQLGSFVGAWLGGRVYDVAGDYGAVWVLAIGLGAVAALLHLPISDKSVVSEAPQPG